MASVKTWPCLDCGVIHNSVNGYCKLCRGRNRDRTQTPFTSEEYELAQGAEAYGEAWHNVTDEWLDCCDCCVCEDCIRTSSDFQAVPSKSSGKLKQCVIYQIAIRI